MRINREEKEKGLTTDEILDTLKRRIGVAWGELTGSGKSPG
jgi:hypothetical protein